MSSKSPFQRLSHWLPSLLGLLLFGASIWAIAQELRGYQLEEILASFAAIPRRNLSLALGLTLLNYITLTGYDALAIQYIRRPLPYIKTAIVSVVSYAISNGVGFALLSGSAIRYRFYSAWGLSVSQIAHIIAFCNLGFWLGLLAVGGVVFLISPVEVPELLRLPFDSVYPIGIAFLILLSAYLIWNVISNKPLRIKNWVFPHLPVQLSLAQIALTSLDWLMTAGVLYVLLPSEMPLSYPGFFGIYLLGQVAGIISNVPGGLGVFETVLLLLLAPFLSSVDLFGALLAYRCIYYFLPLLTAVLMLGIYELQHRLR